MNMGLRNRYPGHEWTPVTDGDSGAFVYRLSGPSALYAKVAPLDRDAGLGLDLEGEAARLHWLTERGFPASRVVDLGSDATVSWLVTEAVPGVSAAEEWPREQRRHVAGVMAEVARALHELPVAECPFDQSLAVTVPQAERNLAGGLVDLDDLEEERLGWPAERLREELARTRPAKEDLVVCHGDLCPNNVLLDPETGRLTGVIDAGRLGRADRHADLALALRELSREEDPWFGPDCVAAFTERYGPALVDPEKLAFYQLLDEFF
ncbi:APH(3') family aminoglycoside O-phosphotransferase [Streptomyces sp. UNOB3_S3]|uniref:APH(3') family aminoglycoside O-phosphotransferase n=1 Tax=Streptomyces sp. UNOB3_S3 TaxID=2871682 RepID=UPI001E511368|nr:APH(3') family aminoglycoside O-phosphotransferase [Streptomyces sp. UNOB3_S3]MCC3776394.1 aminoglycoside 3'-phosphotransferase [Streptomyces sp. UNOB3_S3]